MSCIELTMYLELFVKCFLDFLTYGRQCRMLPIIPSIVFGITMLNVLHMLFKLYFWWYSYLVDERTKNQLFDYLLFYYNKKY